MTSDAIQQLIEQQLPDCKVTISSDDNIHFDAVIISAAFNGKSLVQRQQMVYVIINPYITSGELHAIAMKTMTPEEYARLQN